MSSASADLSSGYDDNKGQQIPMSSGDTSDDDIASTPASTGFSTDDEDWVSLLGSVANTKKIGGVVKESSLPPKRRVGNANSDNDGELSRHPTKKRLRRDEEFGESLSHKRSGSSQSSMTGKSLSCE